MKRILLFFILAVSTSALFGQVEVLNESFDGFALPAGWTVSTVETDPSDGVGNDGIGACDAAALFSFSCDMQAPGTYVGFFMDGDETDFTTGAAVINDDNATSGFDGQGIITTPVMDLSAGGINLTLQYDFNSLSSEFRVEAYDGAAWNALYTATADEHGNLDLDISAYTNADFQVRFVHDDTGGSWSWGVVVDNVVVNANTPAAPGGPTCNLSCPPSVNYTLGSGECNVLADFTVNMVGSCPPTVVPGPSAADFTGPFAEANATTANTNCVDFSGNPATLTMSSIDLAATCDPALLFATYAEYVIPFDGTLTFDWSYTTDDISATWDPFGYFFDASNTFLTLGAIQGGITQLTQDGVGAQTGTASVQVQAGDLFSFMIYTQDGLFGAGSVDITNMVLQAPDQVNTYSIVAQPGTPALGDELAEGTYTAGYDLIAPNGTTAESCTFPVIVNPNPGFINQLNCVQNHQITLDENCSATLTAADILQGDNYSCFDNYVVNILSNTGTPLGNVADGSMTGSTWTVMVTDTSVSPSNSCWAQGITFADKMAPTISCDLTLPVKGFNGSLDPATDNTFSPSGQACWIDAGAGNNGTWLGTNQPYDTYTFDVTTPGSYTFNMTFPALSGFANDPLFALFSGAFNPTDCGNYVDGDDDGGPGLTSEMTVTLAAGTYTLVATNTTFNATGGYEITISSPVMYTSSTIDVDCTIDLDAQPNPVGTDNCDPNPSEQMISETYTDDAMCDDGKMVLERTWIAVDHNGMQSAPCTQTITITQPQVEFPSDITWTCDQYAAHNNIIEATELNGAISDWDTADNQNDIDVNPATGNYVLSNTGSGIPTGWQGTYCKYNVEHTDQQFNHCGPGTFKILRTWTVINLCQNTVQTHDQIILVDDIEAPTMDFTNLGAFETNAAGDITLTLSANNYANHPVACTSTEYIPTPAFADNCSGVDMSTLSIITPVGPVTNLTANGGFIPAPGLTVGVYTDGLTYKIVDNCGNIKEVKITLIIKDDIPPVMLCDQITKVSLTSNGLAQLPAGVPDDGSYDNCGIDHFEIRRMTDNCGINGNTTFDDVYDQGEYVTFCCDDITTGTNNTHTVVVRAYDVYGNYGECMVDVLVEDKQGPQCFAPADVVVDCNEFDPTFWPYGTATGADNCSYTITGPVISGSVDQCNATNTTGINHPIRRTWTVTDGAGQTKTCTQKITVNYVENFKVKFPNDQESSACNALFDTLYPTFIDKDCELAGYSYTDENMVYNPTPGACYGILRHWTIYDWCDFDLSYTPVAVNNPSYTAAGPTVQANPTNHGYFTYTQIITAFDNDAPTIECPASPVEVCDYSTNCSGIVDLTATATDDCSKDNLTFSYTLYRDMDGDGTMEDVMNDDDLGAFDISVSKDGTNAAASIHMNGTPYGTHKIKWRVTDNCGNTSVCEYLFTVKDCKKPTILVDNGIAVNLMNVANGMVTIWPGDPANCGLAAPNVCGWDPSVGDNCTPDNELKIRIRKVGQGTGVPSTTSVTYTCADLGTNNVEIWVGDNAGNWDFTTTYVVIEDNMGVCNPGAPISGALTTSADAGVQNATVSVADASGSVPAAAITTPASGEYAFTGLPLNGNYTITPAKDGNDANGVNVLDLLRIYQAILGNEFTSPYQKLAADVNNSGTVDVQDLVIIRSLTLGKITSFPNVPSWKFYEASCDANAGTCPEIIDVANLTQPGVTNADFIGVKMGDVTGDATPNAYASVDDRTYGEFVLNTTDRMINAGEEVQVTLHANRSDIAAYQFTLNIGSLEFVDVTGKDVSFDNNFALHNDALTTSWNGNAHSGDVFTVTLRATEDVRLSEVLSIDGHITGAMAFDTDELKQEVKLAFDGKVVDQFTLFQNEPNPFSNSTDIKFYLPEATSATLTVYDASGRTLKTVKGDYAKGMSTVSIAKSDLNAVGVLYYKLETASNSAIRKMIIME